MMNRIFIYIMLVCIASAGCRKDEIDNFGPEIDNHIPTEVSRVDISGEVRNENGNLLSGAIVELFRDGNSIAVDVSDESGNYSLESIFTIPGEYRMVINKELYYTNVLSVDFGDDVESEMMDVFLFSNEFGPGEFPLLNPLDSSLIFIEGTFHNDSDLIAPLFILVINDLGEVLNIGATNFNLEFNLAIPRNTSFNIVVLDACGNPIIEDEFFQGFSESTVIYDNEPVSIASNFVTISGTLVPCPGQIIEEGVILVSINDVDFQETTVDAAGYFEFEVFRCNQDPILFISVFYEGQTTWGNSIVIDPFSSDIFLSEVLLNCDSAASITINIDGTDSLTITQGAALQDPFGIHIFGFTEFGSGYLEMGFPVTGSDFERVYFLDMYTNAGEHFHLDEMDDLELWVEIIEIGEESGDILHLNISGQVRGENFGEVFNISGSIIIPLHIC